MSEHKRFTVEPFDNEGRAGVGEFAIRYTPASKKNKDGTRSYGWSFPALIAGDIMSEQKTPFRT
ncbi:hypothetical protein [Flexibacterium corallicola]|uniref:hypothetical protein n=1 Tax=Flexibacterium corallicola TaxID=3037259 RepID=UPI00286F29D4|nr:hypothetical protein [Pseudovibrio sp. M1P-2-3]